MNPAARSLALILAIGSFLSACAAPPGAPPAVVAARPAPEKETRKASAPSLAPSVLIVTSSRACQDGIETPIEPIVEADATLAREAFEARGITPILIADPDAGELQRRIEALPSERGLFFVYSGHGKLLARGSDSCPQGKGLANTGPCSALCLRAEPRTEEAKARPVAVEQVLSWIQAKAPPWATLLLNSCESAYVDVSAVSRLAVSVISASPEDILAATTESKETTASLLVAELASSLKEGNAADTDCDGLVTDRELFASLNAGVRQELPSRRPNGVLPKLRRQAANPLPLYSVEQGAECARLQRAVRSVAQTLTGDSGDSARELKTALEAQATIAQTGALPGLAADYFFLHNPAVHRECAERRAGRSQGIAHVCDVLLRNQELKPVPPSLVAGEECSAAAAACIPDAVAQLGQYLSAADVFFVSFQDEWVHVNRLRDGRRVLTKHLNLDENDMPRRASILGRVRSGDFFLGFRRRVPDERATIGELWQAGNQTPAIESAVCPHPEGQCFYVVTKPTNP